MVTWIEAGSLSGLVYASGKTSLADVPGVLQTAGAQDTNTITRLQINLRDNNTPHRMLARSKFRFVSGDGAGWVAVGLPSWTAPKSPWNRWGAMFITPDSDLSYTGSAPTVTQIITSPAVKVYRGTRTAESAGDKHFIYGGPKASDLQPGRKYWAAVMPTYSKVGTDPNNNDGRGPGSGTPNPTNDRPVNPGTEQSIGRAISFWTNRSPEKPIILSPPHRSVVALDATFPVKALFPDADAINDLDSARSGIIGVQVQYARQPLSPDDNPVWRDIPIGTANRVEPGWVLQGSAFTLPVSPTSPPGTPQTAPTGAAALMDPVNGLTVQAGRVPAPNPTPLGSIPPGDWQIRVRSFDQGNPSDFKFGGVRPYDGVSRFYVPDGLNVPGSTLPYPAFNTSLWSDPVYVSIPTRVPPPVPVSPAGGTAFASNKPVTFRWRYRNTATTNNLQKTFRLELRKVGDPEWETVAARDSADPAFTINPVSEGVGLRDQSLLPDFGFEDGTLGGLSLFGYSGSVSVVNEEDGGTNVAEGNRVLVFSQSGATPASGSFGIETEVLPVRPGTDSVTLRGMVLSPSSALSLQGVLSFRDSSGVEIHSHTASPSLPTSAWGLLSVTAVAPNSTVRENTAFVKAQIIHAPGSTSLQGVRLDAVSLDVHPYPVDPSSYPFVSGNEYEWRVRVTDQSNAHSFASEPARFWVVPPPGSGGVRPVPTETIEGATLGCGTHRVFIYRRGGLTRVGEITDIETLRWGRVRDDVSTARVVVRGWGPDCGHLLAQLQTWAYEMVIFRDNGYSVDRVWEGPLTLLTYEYDRVVLQARDVMVYPYRRIIRQKMSDAGLGSTVVDRAVRVLQNALAPDDPNVLAYLQPLDDGNNSARQYRTTPAYSRTAFEEVDDMASNASLDYTVVGRSILLWGTKQRIGTLPEFRDSDLGAFPIVSEYGMNMANRYAVGDGAGVYGEATRLGAEGDDPIYGLVEVLSSSWASDSASDSGTYTEAGLETIRQSFKEFSERSIADRYPPPVVVRVPDNTSLNPDTVVSIQHLVPGVVVPLRSTGTLRAVFENQKLDSVTVTEEAGVETITITVSPFSREDSGGDDGGGGEE